MLPHPLTNLKIQKHYQNEPNLKLVYSIKKKISEVKSNLYFKIQQDLS